MLKRKLIGIGAMLVASFAVACSSSNDNTSTSMRVINASPNAPAITGLLDGAVIQANISYATPSPYKFVAEDGKTIQITDASTNAILINQDVHLDHNKEYTEILIGPLATLGSLFVQDQNSDPSAGNAAFRFINTAPSMTAVDVYLTAQGADISNLSPNITNIMFGTASSYVEVPGATYEVRLTATGTKNLVLDVPTVPLNALAVRTMLSLDNAGGGVPFQALVLVDFN